MSSYFIDRQKNPLYLNNMQTILTLKVDPSMKAALKKMADKKFISVSAAVKQAIERHLQEQGIDWRKERVKDKPKK